MPKPTDDFNFMAAVKQVLLDEGGDKITDDPKDPGGRTKYGISARFLAVVAPGKKVDDLTEADAIDLYYTHFWKEYRFDELAVDATSVAAKVFNFCITAGPDPAFRCLQRAMRANDVAIKEDGVMGPMTRAALKKFLGSKGSNDRCLYVALRSEMAGYYRDLDQPRFEGGWTARAYR